jgi:hypothetical protein
MIAMWMLGSLLNVQFLVMMHAQTQETLTLVAVGKNSNAKLLSHLTVVGWSVLICRASKNAIKSSVLSTATCLSGLVGPSAQQIAKVEFRVTLAVF